MKVVLATPLYPPEIAEPAPYIKELAKRLSGNHEVTVVAYAHLPEKIPGVRIVTIEKHRPLLLRLIAYTRALRSAARAADIVYAINGPSVELPAGIIARTTRMPFIFGLVDSSAHISAQEHIFRRWSERFVGKHTKKIVREFPPDRPEILPLEPHPTGALEVWENAWQQHVRELEEIFAYVS